MEFLKIINPNLGFEIGYPSHWEIQQQAPDGSAFGFLSPIDGENDAMRENVNIQVQNLPDSTYDLDKFSELSLQGFQTQLGEFEIIENAKRMTLSGIPAEKIVFFGTLQNISFKFQSIYGVSRPHAYILTYTAIDETYEKFLPIFEDIITSLKISPL